MRLRLSLALLVLLLVPAATAMASGRDVLRDCADDEVLSRTYSQKDYRDALSALATDNAEYTDCESIIRRAQLEQASGRKRESGSGGATGGGGGGSAGGSTSTGGRGGSSGGSPTPSEDPAAPAAALTPDELEALEEARTAGGRDLGEADPLAAVAGASRAPLAGQSDLPGPVMGLLILLAGALVLVTVARLRSRVLGRRAA